MINQEIKSLDVKLEDLARVWTNLFKLPLKKRLELDVRLWEINAKIIDSIEIDTFKALVTKCEELVEKFNQGKQALRLLKEIVKVKENSELLSFEERNKRFNFIFFEEVDAFLDFYIFEKIVKAIVLEFRELRRSEVIN